MRGRLWVLCALQSTAAAFCCGLSAMSGSLGGTMVRAGLLLGMLARHRARRRCCWPRPTTPPSTPLATQGMAVCMALATTAASGATFGIGERAPLRAPLRVRSLVMMRVWSTTAVLTGCPPLRAAAVPVPGQCRSSRGEAWAPPTASSAQAAALVRSGHARQRPGALTLCARCAARPTQPAPVARRAPIGGARGDHMPPRLCLSQAR